MNLIHHVWAAIVLLWRWSVVRHHWVWISADGEKRRKDTNGENVCCLPPPKNNDCSNNTSSSEIEMWKATYTSECSGYGYNKSATCIQHWNIFSTADHTGSSLPRFFPSRLSHVALFSNRTGEKRGSRSAVSLNVIWIEWQNEKGEANISFCFDGYRNRRHG